MARRKPPPRTLDPDEERKLQRFLDRAAPVVLESSVLDTTRWGQLVALAEEMELTDEQLRRTIAELRERGVIQKIEVTAPKPPPLPNQGPSEPKPEVPEEEEADFSLAAPPPPPRIAAEEPHPPSPKYAERIEKFRRMATAIIARHRGTGPKAQVLLAAAAEELGLPEEVAREALHSLHRSQPAETDVSVEPPVIVPSQRASTSPGEAVPREQGTARGVEEDAVRSRRWRVEGEPEPAPPPPSQQPADTYRGYVQRSLQQVGGRRIGEDLEQRVLRHGVRVLGLSSVYARHLLAEIAGELQLSLPSQINKPRATDRADVDPQLQSFLDSAAPVLAQHRGINAKSRVMLGALAREQGLSDAQVEKALTLLKHRPDASESDALQKERLAAFREAVRATLRKLPNAILTANLGNKLAEQGRLLHGVADEQIEPAIREVAEACNVSVVSQQQAEEHVHQLITELMGESVRLDSNVRDRIHAEGKQWGLTEGQIETAISDRARSNLKRQRSERNFANFALVAASMALLLLIGFVTWTMIDDQLAASRQPREVEVSPQRVVPPPQEPDRDDSWWAAEMSIAIAMARQEFPQLRAPLLEVGAIDPKRRQAAYKQLTQHMLEDAVNDTQRDRLMDVLSWSYALEPDDATAEMIAVALLEAVPAPEASLSADVEAYPKVFWATRTAIAALERSREDSVRAQRMAQRLGDAVGTSVDYSLGPYEMERKCLGALAERLYRLLISAAAARPEAVSAIHLAIAAEAARYLDAEILDSLNADFLVALIPTAADIWRKYEDLIIQTINSPHAHAVVKLVDLYERTDNEDLQRFMAGPLLRRAGALPETHSVPEIADEVRRALGIGEGGMGEDRWVLLSREANRVLIRTKATSQPNNLMLQDVLDLAHLATLGCALSQDELGTATFDSLRSEGAPQLKNSAEIRTYEPPSSTTGGSMAMLEQSLKMLDNRRSSWVNRIDRLAYLARSAHRFSDIPPRYGETLAAYLLRLKTDAEHAKVLEYASAVARWKHLRLALADGIMSATLRPEQLQGLLSEILGRDVTIGEGTPGREEARSRLLESVFAELNASAVRSAGSYQQYDALRTQLRTLYGVQNQLLGAAAESDSWTTPAQAVRAMTEGYAAQLAAEAGDADAKRQLERIPHDLVAAEYVANDDLGLTVLMERQWIEVLAQAVCQRRPTRKTEVTRILADLVTADREAAHIVEQLRGGQVAMVQLWLAWNEPE
jgi:hypothetical protein